MIYFGLQNIYQEVTVIYIKIGVFFYGISSNFENDESEWVDGAKDEDRD